MQNENLKNYFYTTNAITKKEQNIKKLNEKLNSLCFLSGKISGNMNSKRYHSDEFVILKIFEHLSFILKLGHLKREKDRFIFSNGSVLRYRKFEHSTIKHTDVNSITDYCPTCGAEKHNNKKNNDYVYFKDNMNYALTNKDWAIFILKHFSDTEIHSIAKNGFKTDNDVEINKLKEELIKNNEELTALLFLKEKYKDLFKQEVINDNLSDLTEIKSSYHISDDPMFFQKQIINIENKFDNLIKPIFKKNDYFDKLVKIIVEKIEKDNRCIDGIDLDTLSIHFNLNELVLEASVSSYEFHGEKDYYTINIPFDEIDIVVE